MVVVKDKNPQVKYRKTSFFLLAKAEKEIN